MAGGMDLHKNPHIEEWATKRENLEKTFRFNRRTLSLFLVFGVALPVVIYRGSIAEFVSLHSATGPPITLPLPILSDCLAQSLLQTPHCIFWNRGTEDMLLDNQLQAVPGSAFAFGRCTPASNVCCSICFIPTRLKQVPRGKAEGRP